MEAGSTPAAVQDDVPGLDGAEYAMESILDFVDARGGSTTENERDELQHVMNRLGQKSIGLVYSKYY